MSSDVRSVNVDSDTDTDLVTAAEPGAAPVTSTALAVTTAGHGRKPSWQSRPLGYMPALDGLRAVAVALVMAYHLGYSGAAGGYIGVEVFFVLSGWLVCVLLVNEHQRTGIIGITSFWLRRARRLLPALVTVIVGTLAVASVSAPGQLATLRSHGFAALAYHLNWRLVVDDQSYFQAAEGPSALEHLWSLSIEEQFYLVFPLLCAFGLARWSRKLAVVAVVVAAVGATLLRFALYTPGVDPSRIYFGTDTRAAGLLMGVALGLFWTPNRLRPHDSRRFTAALDALACVGAGLVAWYAFVLDPTRPAAFLGGFTAVQMGTLVLIAVAVYPAPTRTARLLSLYPVRWVGQRSYGIYLIHWPVIVFVSSAPGEQPESPLSVVAQVALVIGLATLMNRLIEHPIRARGLADSCRDAWREVSRWASARVWGRPLVAGVVIFAAVLTVGVSVSVTRDVVTASPPATSQPESVVITASTTAPTTTAADPATAPPATAPVPPAPVAPGAFVPTTAIGDSVLVGAAPALSHRMGPSLAVDAVIGRQMDEAGELIATIAAEGRLGEAVLLHLGNNGPFTAEQIDEVFAVIGPDRTVLLVTVLVPRRWEGEVNDQLVAAAGRHPNAMLVDWRSLVTSEPGLTRDDGFHLTANGAERYADLVVGRVPRVSSG
ncbi:MAG: acyltransferase family protein [Acidimicrobiales bacterium]|nr:acyltransferase family protein [Acidimicrobiales bacterium]